MSLSCTVTAKLEKTDVTFNVEFNTCNESTQFFTSKDPNYTLEQEIENGEVKQKIQVHLEDGDDTSDIEYAKKFCYDMIKTQLEMLVLNINDQIQDIKPKKNTRSAPNSIDETKPWSYQVDGNVVDIKPPCGLMLRLIYNPSNTHIKTLIMPFDAISPNEMNSNINECNLFADLNMNTLQLEIDNDNDNRAYLTLHEEDGIRLDIQVTEEGIIADIWAFIDDEDPELLLTGGGIPEDFDELEME
tara:strand:- start:38 stop:769 length:732 start_codon:yes stop_codon:yes gene_type:complete